MRLGLVLTLILCLWLPSASQSQIKKPEPAKGQTATGNWIVKPPPQKIVLLYGRETSFAVFSNEAGITNLRIVHSSLQDSTTGAQLGPEWLSLCVQKESSCTTPVNVSPNRAERITLRVDPRFQQNGTFIGSVFIASEQKLDPYAFDLAVYSTKRCSQYWGIFLIGVGVALSWVVSSYLQQRALRAEALRPAAELGECLGELSAWLGQLKKQTSFAFPASQAQLNDIRNELSTDSLDNKGFIPPKVRSPFWPSKDLSNEYKQFLGNISTRLQVLGFLMREGVTELLKCGAANDKIASALEELDKLANTTKTLEQAQAGVATIIKRLAPAPSGTVLAPRISTQLPSVTELRVLLRSLSMAMWSIWGVLTVLIGTVALVTTNYGFGVGLDYFKCFFWGLGIQIAGQQLQQLAPATVATTLNVPLPKTK